MLEIVFDRLVRLMTTSLAQLHLRQRRSLARPHHLGALRRLSQFDPAAGDPRGVQGRGVGQFRPVHGQLEPDLFDHRRAARRPARPDRDPHRGPPLHDDRDQPGQAHDRGRARRRRARLQAAVAGASSTSTGSRPIRASPRSRGRPMPRSWCGCASTWKTAAATSSCCCPTRRSSRSATCCCRCSWARSSAATRSGKAISRPRSARPRSPSRRCCTRRKLPLRQLMTLDVGDTLTLELKPDALVTRALRRRHADRRPHGPRRRPRRGARRQAAAQAEDHLRHVREGGSNPRNEWRHQ